MMNRALFQGNGKPSLMTRVEMLEQAQVGFASQCKECKAIILTGPAKRKDAEKVAEAEKESAVKEAAAQKTMITVEKWKAIAAIVTALLASPVLIAIVVALLNK